jgi:hypothetical protein
MDGCFRVSHNVGFHTFFAWHSSPFTFPPPFLFMYSRVMSFIFCHSLALRFCEHSDDTLRPIASRGALAFQFEKNLAHVTNPCRMGIVNLACINNRLLSTLSNNTLHPHRSCGNPTALRSPKMHAKDVVLERLEKLEQAASVNQSVSCTDLLLCSSSLSLGTRKMLPISYTPNRSSTTQ